MTETDTQGTDVQETSAQAGGVQIVWLGTTAAAKYLGITTRTLYRFIDEGQLTAYRFGRVIRMKRGDLDSFITSCRIEPGTISNLYPDPAGSRTEATEAKD